MTTMQKTLLSVKKIKEIHKYLHEKAEYNKKGESAMDSP
jgi:hypothetical protein